MSEIVIDLQAGFANDEVLILVAGQEIFNKKDVNTDYSIGLAASVVFEVFEVSEEFVTIEIAVLSRGLSDSIEVDVSSTSYLGVSILDNKIDCQISDEGFIYF